MNDASLFAHCRNVCNRLNSTKTMQTQWMNLQQSREIT